MLLHEGFADNVSQPTPKSLVLNIGDELLGSFQVYPSPTSNQSVIEAMIYLVPRCDEIIGSLRICSRPSGHRPDFTSLYSMGILVVHDVG